MTEVKGIDFDKLDVHTRGRIKPWQRMLESNNNVFVANAKIAIGNILADKGYKKEALKYWRSVSKEDNKNLFEISHFYIGSFLLKNNGEQYIEKDIQEAKRCFSTVKSKFGFEVKNNIFICDMLLSEETREVGREILRISSRVYRALLLLKVDINSVGKRQFYAERKLAHYTSVNTVNLLLNIDKNEGLPSSFRLNTINNVNDPSEGQLLERYLIDDNKSLFNKLDSNDRYHAFIGCFSFNHDSLNQFRLYGKKDNKEASGISLVFNKGFFKESENPDDLSFISTKDYEVSTQQGSYDGDKIVNNELVNIPSQSVMRCVYVDPESGFISLAQRNKITFYREYLKEEESKSKADNAWKEYQKIINNKAEKFENEFLGLKSIYQDIIQDVSHMDSEVQSKVRQLLDDILLSLRYLIKHTAFQEEQECRMIYITSLEDPKVQMSFGKFLYVDYEPAVKSNLDKVYIAPAATQYQPYLAKLLCDTNVKIELSNNPYRQT